MSYYYKVLPNYARKQEEIKQGRAKPEDLRAGERIIARYASYDEDVGPPSIDYAAVESLECAHACKAELEALGFEVEVVIDDRSVAGEHLRSLMKEFEEENDVCPPCVSDKVGQNCFDCRPSNEALTKLAIQQALDELERKGLVEWTGEYRLDSDGGLAKVWRATGKKQLH
jgi:hypothetical protein